jgi:sugar lactone lactonase YvrE
VTASFDGISWEVAAASGCELAEHPLWDGNDDSLVWVDVLSGSVHRLERSGSYHVSRLGSNVGAVGLRHDGGLVACVDDQFFFLDVAGRPDRAPLSAPLLEGSRFNDAACDPAGRFLAGTAALDGVSALGRLLQLHSDGTIKVLLEDLAESNGMGWSPDGGTFYFVDSGDPRIRRYDYKIESGRIGARRGDLTAFAGTDGVPDGLTVDADGAVWVAMWQGSALRRYASDGQLLAHLPLPVSRPTCPGFGGPALDRLYVTTAWEGMNSTEREAEPWAGHVLSAQVGAQGRPAYRFG